MGGGNFSNISASKGPPALVRQWFSAHYSTTIAARRLARTCSIALSFRSTFFQAAGQRSAIGLRLSKTNLRAAKTRVQFLEPLQKLHSPLDAQQPQSMLGDGAKTVLAAKSISFLVLQRVLQQALKTLKMNAATSDFSVINYEEAKFVITLKDGRKYTVTIAPADE